MDHFGEYVTKHAAARPGSTEARLLDTLRGVSVHAPDALADVGSLAALERLLHQHGADRASVVAGTELWRRYTNWLAARTTDADGRYQPDLRPHRGVDRR